MKYKLNLKNTLCLLLCVLLTISVGGVSGFATASGIKDWYPTLVKPIFNPPNWLFAPVWTLLYTLMGISFYFIIKEKASKQRTNAIRIFVIQLILNFLWSFLFFQFHYLQLAFVDILLLLLSISLMIFYLKEVHPWAGWLQIPYFLWVGFASTLNGAIVYLN